MKKRFPVAALEVTQPFVEKAKDFASPIIDEKYVLFLKDNDNFDESNHYFNVVFEVQEGTYRIEMSPYSSDTIIANSYRGYLGDIEKHFNVWLDVMKRYKNQKTIYDNPARYQAEYFYSEFKIIDEDADIAPFNTKQIFLIDEYIESYKKDLLALKNEGNSKEIDEIIAECDSLQDTVYSTPKNKVIEAVAKIWGKTVTKLKKEGRKFIGEYFEKFKTEVIAGTVGAAIEGAKTLINLI